MKTALIQMCSGTDRDKNLGDAEALIRAAVADGAQLVVTPEMTPVMQRHASALLSDLHDQNDDPSVKFFGWLAKELGVFLLIGSIAVRSKTGVRAANRSFLFSSNGAIAAAYDKIHMFDVTVSAEETWTESKVYAPGDEFTVVDMGDIYLGMTVCYDLRFPDQYKALTAMGANVIAVPSAFTRPTGRAHWEPLLRARAIENACYILAAAQGGEHEDGRKTWGHSMIIDPWGEIIAHKEDDTPGYIMADIDLEKIDEARRKIPAWSEPSAQFEP